MDANELRIGNYVYVHGGDDQTFCKKGQPLFVSTITTVSTSSIWWESVAEIDKLDYKHQSIKPIPLTEQWLKDFGFTKIQDGYFEYFVMKYWNKIKTVESKFMLSLENMGDGETGQYYIGIWIGADSVVHIYTVHQLQNLYYMLTGNELTRSSAEQSSPEASTS